MLWGIAAIAAVGLILGTRFKAPGLIIASIATATAVATVALVAGWSLLIAFIWTFIHLSALQSSYLLGLWLAGCGSPRARREPYEE